MRMTRAALRAQEAEDELQAQVEVKLKEQGLFFHNIDTNAGEPFIHEDESLQDEHDGTETQFESENDRPILRDITQENYPVPNIEEGTGKEESDEKKECNVKSNKGTKGRKGKKQMTKPKDYEAQVSQDEDVEQELTQPSPLTTDESSQEALQMNSNLAHTSRDANESLSSDMSHKQLQPDVALPQTEEPVTSHQETPYVSSQMLPATPSRHIQPVSKTPRFNPEVHLPAEKDPEASQDSVEDSFVESIKTRSPSKFSQSAVKNQIQEAMDTLMSPAVRRSPLVRMNSHSLASSPPRIEDSVEAIDALEDAIEKFAEDLPVIEALTFESPVKSRKSPSMSPVHTPAKVSPELVAKSTVKKPKETPARMSIVTDHKTLAKTPGKAPAKTPLRSSTVTTTTKQQTPPLTKSATTPHTLRSKVQPTHQDSFKARAKAIETKATPAAHRRATSLYVPKKEVLQVRPTLKSKHVATKSVPSVGEIAAPTMSFSNSPAKQDRAQTKKRVTSSGTLSTSKPGFVPAKSSKPITTSTFTLPGEAISAKIKAQREERLKKEEAEAQQKATFKARPAPSRTARPSVMPRENKASTARISTRQASGENKENMAPIRVASMTGPGRSSIMPASKPVSTTTTTTSAAASSTARRTTIAPKLSSTIDSKKPAITPPASTTTVPTQTSQRISSLTSGQQITLTKEESAQQRQKNKEVYGRIRGSVQQLEDERRAKEEAAKKARAEAAEKGRLASREWAEKQRKKMAGVMKVDAAEVKV